MLNARGLPKHPFQHQWGAIQNDVGCICGTDRNFNNYARGGRVANRDFETARVVITKFGAHPCFTGNPREPNYGEKMLIDV